MTQALARVPWLVWLATSAAITALGVLFLAVGLDNADKYASVIGALGTVAGLGLSLSALMHRPSRSSPPPDESGVAGQQVQASSIGGDSLQVRGVGGNVRVGHAMDRRADGGSPGRSTPPSASSGAQSVTGSKISGSSVQIEQVSGDVDIQRET